MATFVYAVMSISQVASMHCVARPEISPCSCEPFYAHNYVELSCEKVDSFHTIVNVLSNKFEPNINVSLKIAYSQLDDLEMCSFKDMKFNIVKLRILSNDLKVLPEPPFRGLSNVEYLGIGDNELEQVPKHVLNNVPIVKTLDMGRCRIRSILQDDFKRAQMIRSLFLASNNITLLEKGSFPPDLFILHLGRNQIESLNGTLRDLNKLGSLFINTNFISDLQNELPESNSLKMFIAHTNRLKHLPESMRNMYRLENVILYQNHLVSLNKTFKHAKNLNELVAHKNEITNLDSDEFLECNNLEKLDLAWNHIKSFNGSLLHLIRLVGANFSHNEIEEFSLHEIRGLMKLQELDMSYNRIQKLIGRQKNNVEQYSNLNELNLDNNLLKSLDGALMGLNSLKILSLSYNQIERILPEDFIGLVRLEILELSHNQILTLKEMETTFLPSLKILKVSHNNLTRLEKDFHGLPVLCQAHLSSNQISIISPDLVSQTRCMNHNVPGKLELHLEDNPIMCEERLNEMCSIMLAQEAKIRGRSKCFEADQEVCTALPMLFTKIYMPDNIPLLLQQQTSAASVNNKLVQVILPALIRQRNDEIQLPPLIAPLGQPIIKPLAVITTPSTTLAPKENEIEQTTTTSTTTTSSTTTTTTATTVTPEVTSTQISPTTIITTTPTLPKSNLISVEDQPLVLDIEELPHDNYISRGALNYTEHATDLKVITPNMGEITNNATKSMSDTVTVAQSEYSTVEYIPNIDFLPPDAKSSHEPLPLDLKSVPNRDEYIKNENIELPDSKSNLVHDEYPAVILANGMENTPQGLENPPEVP